MLDMKNIVKALGSQGFLVGIGVAALGYFLAPQLKETLRPTAVKGTQGIMALGNKTKQILEDSKEKISGLIFEKPEGAINNVKEVIDEKDISSKILKELIEERESSNKILSELKESILSLKEEISYIKHGENFQES